MLELEVHGWERWPNRWPPGKVVHSSVLHKLHSGGTPSSLYSRYFVALLLTISFINSGFLTRHKSITIPTECCQEIYVIQVSHPLSPGFPVMPCVPKSLCGIPCHHKPTLIRSSALLSNGYPRSSTRFIYFIKYQFLSYF